jgi:hypothetical protein
MICHNMSVTSDGHTWGKELAPVFNDPTRLRNKAAEVGDGGIVGARCRQTGNIATTPLES